MGASTRDAATAGAGAVPTSDMLAKPGVSTQSVTSPVTRRVTGIVGLVS